MEKGALIVFAKNLQEGKVKTRLAASVGDAKALKIYSCLLNHTYQSIRNASCSKYVFYSDWIETSDKHGYSRQLQKGKDLGERMLNAFREIFEMGYQKVVIIGSDSPDISSHLIDHAFSILAKRDVVIGPSTDGGYYLLGMNRLHNELFEDIRWSTSEVFERTTAKLSARGLTYEVLEQLRDIDEEKDWVLYKATLIL